MRSKTITRSTFTRFATALAIGAALVTASGAANARGGYGGGHGGGSFHSGSSTAAFSGVLSTGVVKSLQTYSVTPVRDHRGQAPVYAPPKPCYTVVCGPGTYNASHRRSDWPGTVRDHR